MRELSALRYSDLNKEEKEFIKPLFIGKVGEDESRYDKFLICKSIDGEGYFLYYYPECDW